MQTYHNTNGLTGDDLKNAIIEAQNQQEAILMIFQKNKGKLFQPSEILKIAKKSGKNLLLTSVRRSLTNLTDEGHLIKTHFQGKGIYGKPEHKWMYKERNTMLTELIEDKKA